MATQIIQDTAAFGATGHTAGDTVIIQNSGVDITTTLDATGLATGGYALVKVVPTYHGVIGTEAVPLRAEISSGTVARLDYFTAAGQMYYRPNGDADVCDLLRVGGGGIMNLVTGGTVTLAELWGGTTNIGEAVAVTTLEACLSALVNMPDATSTDPTTVLLYGNARWNTERGATTATIRDSATADVDAGTNVFTTINVDGGNWRHRDSGTITNLNWRNGVFDATSLERELTITNTTINKKQVDQAALLAFLNHPLITLSNAIVWEMDAA
jgi:hypothetical protein